MQLRGPAFATFLFAFTPGLLTACGGASFQGHEFRRGTLAYRVGDLGTGWERLQVQRSNDLAWIHEATSAVIQVNASCDPALDIPLTALTNHLLIGFTERVQLSQATTSLNGREALKTHVRAKLDGVPREAEFIVLKKNGCTYDLSLVGPADERFSQDQPTFERFAAAFHTESP